MLIVVCEDNPVWLKRIGETLNNYNKEEKDIYEVKLFTSVEDLLDYSMSHKPDIAYLDIQVGEGNGLDTAKTLEVINKDILIIYISAYEDYYYDALQTAPFRYIKKEEIYNEKDVLKTLEEALERLQSKYYFCRFSGKDYMLDLTEIRYIYSKHRKIYFVGNRETRYFYGKLDDVEKEIKKKDKMLVRINQSTIINMRYIQYISLWTVEIDGQAFKVSSKYKDNFLNNVQKFT